MKVLMIGPDRKVQGGISTVVNQYYAAGLDKQIELKYIATMQDGSKFRKILDYYLCMCDFDIIHVHMSSRASFYRKSVFIKIAHLAKKKIIIHMHGSEFNIFYENECNNKQKKKIREIFLLADVIIALSDEWKVYLSKYCDDHKIIVLNNAIKIPLFVRDNFKDRNVLFLGRLGRRKGTYDLIAAIPKVLEKNPHVHFYFGGDGEIEACKKICIKTHVQNNVTFLGWITGGQKEEYLKKCSTFILPSYHEGMPMAILEAMAYGNIVIATPVGGIPEVIHTGQNGYLIDTGDIDGIADTILLTINDTHRNQIGMNAHETIHHNFNIEKNLKRLIKIYQNLFDSKAV